MPTNGYNAGDEVKKASAGYNAMSQMTIPQLKRCQEILEKKLKSEQVDEFSKRKIEVQLSKYVKAQFLINKYWKQVYSKQPGANARNRNTITLLEAYKNKNRASRGINGGLVKDTPVNGWAYNALDLFEDVKGVALGIGVTAIGLGVADHVFQSLKTAELTNSTASNIMELLKTTITDSLGANAYLILGGAALVVAAIAIPAMRRKADQMRRHKTYARDLQNELTDEIHNNLDGFDPSDFTADNYKNKREKAIQTIFDNYEVLSEYCKNLLNNKQSELNNSQRQNILDALNAAKEKYEEFDKNQGEFSTENQAWAKIQKKEEEIENLRKKLEEKQKQFEEKQKQFEEKRKKADDAGEQMTGEIEKKLQQLTQLQVMLKKQKEEIEKEKEKLKNQREELKKEIEKLKNQRNTKDKTNETPNSENTPEETSERPTTPPVQKSARDQFADALKSFTSKILQVSTVKDILKKFQNGDFSSYDFIQTEEDKQQVTEFLKTFVNILDNKKIKNINKKSDNNNKHKKNQNNIDSLIQETLNEIITREIQQGATK